MNILTSALTPFLYFIFLSIILISCSSEEPELNNFDHTHSETIDLKKHLFEHEFSRQCVIQESVEVADTKVAKKRLSKQCMCIATYLFKDLAIKDSYTLLNDKKQAKTLKIKYEKAIKQCM